MESSRNSENIKSEFEKIFKDYYAPLCVFAENYLSSSILAEDLVQEVFIALWNRKDDLDQINAIKSFLYTSVRNKCLNQLKHLKAVNKHTSQVELKKESETFFQDYIIEEETHRLIHNAINELPPKCKEILLLSMEGMKNSEIAENLNISINTIKTQKAIAYRELRFKLKSVLALSPLIFEYLFR